MCSRRPKEASLGTSLKVRLGPHPIEGVDWARPVFLPLSQPDETDKTHVALIVNLRISRHSDPKLLI